MEMFLKNSQYKIPYININSQDEVDLLIKNTCNPICIDSVFMRKSMSNPNLYTLHLVQFDGGYKNKMWRIGYDPQNCSIWPDGVQFLEVSANKYFSDLCKFYSPLPHWYAERIEKLLQNA